MLTIQGTGVSSGVAVGPLRFFKRNSQAADIAGERQRFADAQAKAIDELGRLPASLGCPAL